MTSRLSHSDPAAAFQPVANANVLENRLLDSGFIIETLSFYVLAES